MVLRPIMVLLFAGVCVTHAKEVRLVGHFCSLPPVMEKLYGAAVIHQRKARGSDDFSFTVRGAGSYEAREGVISARHRAHVILKGVPDQVSLEKLIAQALLSDFHNRVLALEARSRHEKRLRLTEIVPLTRENFIALGTRRLLEGKSGVEWFDAWWTIRMGLPQTHDPRHHLVSICLLYDHDGEKGSLGHFCFGLRRRGGDAQNDLVFDFRSEWSEDRPPNLLEGMNSGNTLEPLVGFTANFYDWLYTQTSYRHCYVNMWFLPVSREQVTVLRAFDRRVVRHDAGDFKGLRKNCASLGLAFVDRLEPFFESSSLGKGLADIPTKAAEQTVDKWGDDSIPFFRLGNNTHESGREPTAKSKVHRAQPSRVQSRSFRLLRGISAIN